MMDKVCQRCAVVFRIKKSRKDTAKFCSLRCFKLSRRETLGYSALHAHIGRIYGKPQTCEVCGINEKRKYEWANLSGEYKIEREDWKRVCTPCHNKIDLKSAARGEKNGGAKLTKQEVKLILELIAHSKMTLVRIGQLFNVTDSTIRMIKKGQTWKHLPRTVDKCESCYG